MIRSDEVVKARTELAPMVRRIKGLTQISLIFTNAYQMAKYFEETFSQCSFPARVSFSKGIIVDYAKPWTKNQSPFLLDFDKRFLAEREQDSTHSELIELRDKMVAHIDKDYESFAFIFTGTLLKNPFPKPNTLEEIFIPLQIRLEAGDALWWINDLAVIRRIRNHIEFCQRDTNQEIRNLANELRQAAFRHAHVLNCLGDIISLRMASPNPDGSLRVLGTTEGDVAIRPPKETKIGRKT